MNTGKSIALGILLAGLVSPAMAGLFNSCDGAGEASKPRWVGMPDYSIQGFYTAVGIAEKGNKTSTQQRQQSEADAKQHLVEQIEVNIRSENKQSKSVTNSSLQQSASSEISVTADEVLRDFTVRERWVDPDNCTAYTLVAVSRDSVIMSKTEKRSRLHFNQMKSYLSDGTDRELNRDPQIRKTALEQAQLEYAGIDFASINETYSQTTYAKRIKDGLDAVNKEILAGQSRIACKAFNPDGTLPPAVVRKLVDRLNASGRKIELLLDDCDDASSCRGKARERGYGQLITLRIDASTETSAMGAMKGTMTVSETVYDITHDKVLKTPPAVSAQVIGWDNEELNWGLAADKIAQDLQ